MLKSSALRAACGPGVIEGYASLFGVVDMAGDTVVPGAFRDSLKQRATGEIRMLFQHDPGEPVGVWTEIREDRRGLFVRGKLIPGVARAHELHALLQAGAIDGLSIGFKTVRARHERRNGVRLLEKIDLWEISVVTFPLLPQARVRPGRPEVRAGPPADLSPGRPATRRCVTARRGASQYLLARKIGRAAHQLTTTQI